MLYGKTTLAVTFSKGTLLQISVPPDFENFVTDIEVDGQPIKLNVWDTAGMVDYDRPRPLSYSRYSRHTSMLFGGEQKYVA